jgi:hypothetical protein
MQANFNGVQQTALQDHRKFCCVWCINQCTLDRGKSGGENLSTSRPEAMPM